MKNLKIILLIVVAALLLSGGVYYLLSYDSNDVEHIIYEDDYSVLYADELQKIFGYYTVGERVRKHIEGESCSCGYHQDTIDYSCWEITYTDICGDSMTCELDNRMDIYEQQITWMEDQIGAHFYNSFVMKDCTDVFSEGSYSDCRVGDICTGWSGEEQYRQLETTQEYRKNLAADKGIIPLNTLKYDTVFDDYPITLSIHVALDDEAMSPAVWQSNFEEKSAQIDEMIRNILVDTDGTINMSIQLYSRADAVPLSFRDQRWYYVDGKQVLNLKTHLFDDMVFESYTGKFWE